MDINCVDFLVKFDEVAYTHIHFSPRIIIIIIIIAFENLGTLNSSAVAVISFTWKPSTIACNHASP